MLEMQSHLAGHSSVYLVVILDEVRLSPRGLESTHVALQNGDIVRLGDDCELNGGISEAYSVSHLAVVVKVTYNDFAKHFNHSTSQGSLKQQLPFPKTTSQSSISKQLHLKTTASQGSLNQQLPAFSFSGTSPLNLLSLPPFSVTAQDTETNASDNFK